MVQRFYYKDGKFNELENLGKLSMASPQTLADFVTFSAEEYPADDYILILWDHGGGVPIGYGVDELFPYENLYDYQIGQALDACEVLRQRIEKEIRIDAPFLINKGGVIADGVNAELDELRSIAYSGKDYLLQIQQREIERTGIQSLKIGFNNVFGYYMEVRNTFKDHVPPEWIRKQTLVSAERYITQELKEYEEKILGAEEKILALETRLFTQLVTDAADFIAKHKYKRSVPLRRHGTIQVLLCCQSPLILSFKKAFEY